MSYIVYIVVFLVLIYAIWCIVCTRKKKITPYSDNARSLYAVYPINDSDKYINERRRQIRNRYRNPDGVCRMEKDEFLNKHKELTNNMKYVRRLYKTNVKEIQGHLYVFSKLSAKGKFDILPKTKYQYKIGRTKNLVEERIGNQSKSNGENYIILRKVRTNRSYAYENLVHILLHEFKAPRNVADGGSEWFKVPLILIDESILIVRNHLEEVWNDDTAIECVKIPIITK